MDQDNQDVIQPRTFSQARDIDWCAIPILIAHPVKSPINYDQARRANRLGDHAIFSTGDSLFNDDPFVSKRVTSRIFARLKRLRWGQFAGSGGDLTGG